MDQTDFEENYGEDSLLDSIKSTLKIAGNRKMIAIIPLIVYTGTSIAYWAGMIAPLIQL